VLPELQEAEPGRHVACHRAAELGLMGVAAAEHVVA